MAALTAMEIIAIAGATITAGTSIYESVEASNEQEEAEQLQEEQLKTPGENARAAAARQAVVRDQKLEAIQSQQRAAAVAHGMALSSGAFSALQEASFNNFAQDNKIANMNLQITEDDINGRIDAARSQLHHEKTQDWIHGIAGVGSAMMSMGSMFGSAGKAASAGDGGLSATEKGYQGYLKKEVLTKQARLGFNMTIRA